MPNQIIPLLKKSVAGLLILSIGLPPVALAQQTAPHSTGCAPIMGRAFYGACPVAPLSNFQNEQVLRRARRLFVVPRNQLPNNPAQWNDLVHGRSRVDAVEFRFFPERGFASTPGTGNNPGLYFQVIRHQNGRARALGGNSFPLSDGSQAFGLDYSTYNETRLGLHRSYEELYEQYWRDCWHSEARSASRIARCAGVAVWRTGLSFGPPIALFYAVHSSSREQRRLLGVEYFQDYLRRKLTEELGEAAVHGRMATMTPAEKLPYLFRAYGDDAFFAALTQDRVAQLEARISALAATNAGLRERVGVWLDRNFARLWRYVRFQQVGAPGAERWAFRGVTFRSGMISTFFRKFASNSGFLALFGAGIFYGGILAFVRDGTIVQLPFASQIAAFFNSTPETETEAALSSSWHLRGRASFFREEYVDRFYLHNYLNIAHQSLGVNGRIVSCLGGAVNPIGMADSQQILEGAAQAAVAGEQLAAAQGQAAPNATPTPAQAEEQATAQAFNELPPSSGGNCVVSHQLNASNEDYVCSNEHNTCVIAQTDRSSIADLSDRMHRYFSNYVRTAHRLRLDGTFLNQPSGQAGGH